MVEAGFSGRPDIFLDKKKCRPKNAADPRDLPRPTSSLPKGWGPGLAWVRDGLDRRTRLEWTTHVLHKVFGGDQYWAYRKPTTGAYCVSHSAILGVSAVVPFGRQTTHQNLRWFVPKIGSAALKGSWLNQNNPGWRGFSTEELPHTVLFRPKKNPWYLGSFLPVSVFSIICIDIRRRSVTIREIPQNQKKYQVR